MLGDVFLEFNKPFQFGFEQVVVCKEKFFILNFFEKKLYI